MERAPILLDLRGRSAVVTGGAVGIGAAIVERLARAGASVLLTDAADAGAGTAEAMVAEGLDVRFQRCDITDTDALTAAAEAGSTTGPLHIWVNNAGIYPTTGPVLDVEDEFLVRMLDVNVRAQLSAVREAARRMTGGGSIVNLASIAGLRGGAGISAYSTSKAAVIGMTRALAAELGPAGIRVNAVAPGIIDTPGVRSQLAPLQAQGIDVERRMGGNPLGMAGKPHHVADVCLFLVSDLAAFVTGVTVVADGGSSL